MQTSDIEVTETWTNVGSSDSGTLIFQNVEHEDANDTSNDINYAWMSTQVAPGASVHGGLIAPKQSISRGSETGYLYVKCLNGTRRGALTE